MAPPKVFISYSHDSEKHKGWVRKLCTKLREKSVDVILDQWDLGPGDDRILFMERGVKDSDRVLVVCTDAYVKKANARERGAGYEGYIITAEFVDDLGTDKFIPIIRESSDNEKAPIFLTPKVYIDFTDDDQFDASFDQLLREIHGAPLYPKPPLGKNPFSKQLSEPEASNRHHPDVSEKLEFASQMYREAIELTREDDTVGWQQLVKQIRRDVSNSLKDWKPEFEQEERNGPEEILKTVDKAVDIVSPLISIALAGIESGEESFRDQKPLIHDLLSIVEWKESTYPAWSDMPNVLGYVYHSLHGGLSLKTNQLHLALSLVQENVRNIPIGYRGKVWAMPKLTGYSYFSVRSVDLWKHLVTAYKRWEWLNLMFTNATEYRVSLVAYYIALNMHELAAKIKWESQEGFGTRYYYAVSLNFLSETHEIKERAIDMLMDNSTLSELWTCLGVTQKQMENSWETWIEMCEQWFFETYQGYNFESDVILFDHIEFFDNLLKSTT